MNLQGIKETKRYGRTDNVKTVYPPQTKCAGGINIQSRIMVHVNDTLSHCALAVYEVSAK